MTAVLGHGEEWTDRTDPARWLLWRCGPLPFPTEIEPAVPEMLSAGPAIQCGKFGKEFCLVLPEGLGESFEDRALRGMANLLIHDKGRNTRLVTAREWNDTEKTKQLLLLGTLATNSVAREVLAGEAPAFLSGIPAGGYRIAVRPSPFAQGRRVILALGADAAGAWAAAGVMAFSVRGARERLGQVERFPVQLPEGMCWAPFEARYTGLRDVFALPPLPEPAPVAPRVPFGMRIWGSPAPTLDSYQRLIRALKPLGINTVVVQLGGWPDLPDAAARCRSALDIAYHEGLFTVLYAGNEMAAHLPSPLTANHQAMVAACDEHPGLLEWHLYNQLASKLTPEQRALVAEQTRWLSARSQKPVGHEIVWGHNVAAIPEDKAQLIRDGKEWGMSVVASDYAPLGGWSQTPDLSRWEARFLNLRAFGLPTEAVLQAHVPFLDPVVPTAAEVRSQFWWALAGGARAFYFETACLFSHLSYRGILGWDLRPLSDGRYDEIGRLAATAKRLETVIAESDPLTADEAAKLGVAVASPGSAVAWRLRAAKDGRRWLLLINRRLDQAADATIQATDPAADWEAIELEPTTSRQVFTARSPLRVMVSPAGGACYELRRRGP